MKNVFALCSLLLALCTLHAARCTALAADRYASPAGLSTNAGTEASPWDLGSALSGTQPLGPGDTLYLEAGTYKATFAPPAKDGWKMTLAGSPGHPLQIRPTPGERAILDGGLVVMKGADVEVYDLYLTATEPKGTPAPGARPYRPMGGLQVFDAPRSRFVNLVIDNALQGVSYWEGAVDSEIYGCIITRSGWTTTDGIGHAHALYTQNATGWKRITDNILLDGASYGLHAYGEAAHVDNYRVEGNLIAGFKTAGLVGGALPSRGIRLADNMSMGGIGVGYTSGNVDAEISRGITLNGVIATKNFVVSTLTGNVFTPPGRPITERPAGVSILFRPNRYDATRAHVGVMNWRLAPSVTIPTGTFLAVGAHWELMDPRDPYGAPLFSGISDGTAITIPYAQEFGAFLLFKR